MARLILNATDLGGDIGASTTYDVVGTNGAETINVAHNGKGQLDGSFSRGNDTIVFDGNAADYSVRQADANHVAITNSTGANLIIPVGSGVTIKFNDDLAGRSLSFGSSNAIVLGTQIVTGAPAPIATDASSLPPPDAGSLVIELLGASAVHAVGGGADDVIYTDKSVSGSRATWVFNSMDDTTRDINHLQSQTRVAVTGVNNLGLLVTFQDIESRVVVVGNSNAGGAGATITDLTINQAIKDAINTDPTLKYLLVARDGPSGTLIVESRVDGRHVNTDLQIALANTGALTTGQSGHIITAAELNTLGFAGAPSQLGASSAGFAALGSTSITDDRWYSDFGLSPGPLTGRDSANTNTNVVEGGTGNDLIVLSTNGQGGVFQGMGSSETVDINGVFTTLAGQDTVLNFTSAVGALGLVEVQTLTFAGTAAVAGAVNFAEPPMGNGINQDTLGTNYTIAPVAFAVGDTAATIATNVANAINAAAGYPLASATGGVVTLTYAANTGNIPQDSVTITSVPAQEQQSIVLTAAGGAAPNDATLTAGSISVTFDGVIRSVTIAAGDTADTVGAALASAFGSTYQAAYNTATNALVLRAPHTGNIDPAIVGISQAAASGGNVALDYDVNTLNEGTTVGVTEISATSVDGVVGLPGYDIFDLTTLMGGPVAANFRNDAPGNGADPDGATYAEGARVQFATLNGGSIVITDTLDGGDYNAVLAGAAPTAELDRIAAIAKAADTVASAAVARSVIITVDEDNIGHFYLITNGTAAGDTTTLHLGNIELATYDDPSKSAVGDWDTMTITNFLPMTAENVINVFSIA